MTRILMYDPYHDAHFGAQRSLIALARGVAARGHQPIVATGREGAFSQAARQAGLPVEIIPIPESIDLFERRALTASKARKALILAGVVRYAARVARRARALGVDVLYANDLRSVLFFQLARRLSRTRLVWSIQGGHAFGALSTFAALASDEIVLCSHAAGKAVPDGVRDRVRGKMAVNYVGIEVDAYAGGAGEAERAATRRRLGLPEDAVLVTSAGSISPRKGFDTLVEAIARLAGQGAPVHLAIAGEPAGTGSAELMEMLRRRVDAEHLPVTFVGWMDDLRGLLRATDVFALASREEGLGRVILEAMATGVPAVVTRAGGSEETVVEGESGFIVDPDDPAALAERVGRLVADAPLRAAMGRAGRRRCEEVFSEAMFVDRFARMLEAW